MFEGAIKTKDIFLHPLTLIHMRGLKGYLKLVYRALSPRKHHFVNNIEKTGWIYVGDSKKK